MDYTLLGGSGLKVSSLCFGLGTFGGGTEFFRVWGSTGVEEGKRLVGLCLDAASMSSTPRMSTPTDKHSGKTPRTIDLD
jgi:hypothetical protein